MIHVDNVDKTPVIQEHEVFKGGNGIIKVIHFRKNGNLFSVLEKNMYIASLLNRIENIIFIYIPGFLFTAELDLRDTAGTKLFCSVKNSGELCRDNGLIQIQNTIRYP